MSSEWHHIDWCTSTGFFGDIDCDCPETEREIAVLNTYNKLKTKDQKFGTWLCGPPSSKGQFQQYPSRFLYNLKRSYPEFVSDRTLHMFSGSSDFGITTDLLSKQADIKSDYQAIPFQDHSMNAVLADPPYADHWAGQWHEELPKPKNILREAVRIVKPGGLIGILHIIIIPAYKELGVKRIALHPILAGPNNAIRVFNVFRAE